MRRNKIFLLGMPALALVFGLTVMGCDNGTTTPTEYTVTFNPNGGTVTTESIPVEEGKTVDSLPTPSKTSGDTVFWGWYTETGTGGNWGIPFTTLTVITSDITVYARWGSSASTKITVTFDADAGTVTPTSISVITGDKAGALPIPTKPGNTFGGWYTAKNGGGTAFTATSTVTAAITVYAKWTASGSGGGDSSSSAVTFTGIDPQYNGQYATFRSSSRTEPTGGIYLLGGNLSSSTIIGVQISGGSVTIPAHLVVSENSVVPYTGNDKNITIYLIIKSSSSFTGAEIFDGRGQYTSDSVNFSNGSASVNVGGGTPGAYTLSWGILTTSYDNFSAGFSQHGVTLTSAGANAGYLTGTAASGAFTAINNNPEAAFDDFGEQEGSFEEFLNFQENGIGLPTALKTAMTAQKASVPLLGVFSVGDKVIVFYISKN
jgi:uncharacterized repeat protein (TIGR02543 family)